MFDVEMTTGVLTYDDTAYPATTKRINDTNLMIDGNGSFYIENGNVYVDNSPFVRADRRVHIRATIKFRDNSIAYLGDEDCVRYDSASDIGAAFPFGANPVSTHTLVLANMERVWDTGGLRLGNRSFDGADVMVELGAEDENNVPQFVAMGRFLVDKIDNQYYNTVLTLSGSDYMGNKMMTKFVYTPSDPTITSGAHIAALACSLAGVAWDTNSLPDALPGDIVKPTFTSPATCRDVVGWVAQLYQSHVYIDGGGILKFRSFNAGEGTITVRPSQYTKITTSVPFAGNNYKLEAKSYSGSNTYSVTYEPFAGAPFYSFSITISPFRKIDATTEPWLRDNCVSVVGQRLNYMTSGVFVWRGDGYIPPMRHMAVRKPNDSEAIFMAFQHRVSYDGSLFYETGLDLNSLTKNITEGRL